MVNPINNIYRRSEDNRDERVIIVTVFLVLHIFSQFMLIHYSLPMALMQISSALLLIVAGWLFGIQGAVVVWLIVLFASGVLFEIKSDQLLKESGNLTGTFIFTLIIGSLSGLVSELYLKYRLQSQQLQNEIIRRRDKELLFKELNHRTKNNLALIAGFLDLQIFNSTDQTLINILTGCKTRVLSIAELHKDLYQSDSNGSVNIRRYIDRLISIVEKTYVVDKEITIKRSVDDISMDAGKAVAYSLIINELLTNALKHAFNGRTRGRVTVEFRIDANRTYLKVKDNGIGLPDGFEEKINSGDSTIGMLLVKGLVDQLNATLETKNRNGACFIISGENPV